MMTEHERDERVTRAYRALGEETPPAALDAAILAASRRRGARWQVPLASAAALVLAVAVAVVVDREAPKENVPVAAAPPAPAPVPSEARPVESEKQADQAAKPLAEERVAASREVPEAEADRRDDLAKSEPAPASRSRVELSGRLDTQSVVVGQAAPKDEPPPSAPAESRESAPQPLRLESQVSTVGVRGTDHELLRERGVASGGLGPQAVPAPPAPPAASAASGFGGAVAGKRTADDESVETPEQWLERIAKLREAGRAKEADDALAAFRKRYPDYEIPKEMRERVLPR